MAKGRISKASVEAIPAADRDTYLWDDKLPGFGVKVTPAGKRVYITQYRVGGRKGRTRRVTIGQHGVKTEHEARKEAKLLLGEAQAGTDPAHQRDKARATDTFGNSIERFLSEHVEAKLKEKTATEYRRVIKLHLPSALRNRLLTDINRADISRLHYEMKQHPYQANRFLAVLSKFFNWCEALSLRPDNSNPCRHVQKFPEKGRERFLTADELARLGMALEQAETDGLPWQVDETRPTAKHLAPPEQRFTISSPFVVAAIRLFALTGARLSEILELEWSMVDLERQQLRLDDSKTGRKSIYLNPPAVDVLSNLPRLAGNPYVICGEKPGAHLVNLQKPWRRIRKAAGLDDVRLHDLRHTFASWGAIDGLPLQMIQGLLSHSNLQTTQRYAHLSADPLKASSERVGGAISAAMGRRDSTAEPGETVVP